jgi:hypothetical protein
MLNYIYYWIPNNKYFNCDLKPFSKEENISDYVEDQKNVLKIDLLENKDLKINYREEEFLLNYVEHTEKGLFVYKFDNIEDKELLKIQVYHLFKEICHVHNSHHDEEDSLLEAYVSEELNTSDAISFYCETYIQKFKNYKLVLEEFKVNTENFEIVSIINQKKLLIKLKEELLYAFFLAKDTDYLSIFTTIEKKIEILYKKLELVESAKLFKVNDIINRWQFFLGLLGILLGTGGIYYGFYGATGSSQQIVLNNINQFSEKIIVTNKKLETMNSEIINLQEKSKSNRKLMQKTFLDIIKNKENKDDNF